MKEQTIKKKKKSSDEVRGYGALTVVGFVFLAVYTLSLLIPVLWAFMTTFKTSLDFDYNIFGLPKKWTLANYEKTFLRLTLSVQPTPDLAYDVYVWQMFGNGVLYTVGCTLTSVFVPAIVAYGCARYQSVMGKILHATVLFVMVLPIIGSMPSEMQVVRKLGFYNNLFGMYIMKANFLGTDFLIFYAAFKGISKDYADAASIDGAGHFTIMIKIMFPLIVSTFSTMMLLAMIGFWNDSSTPLMYTPDVPNMALGLFKFSQKKGNDIVNVPTQLTGCFIMFMPIFIIFVAFRKKFMLNVSIGGLKG